MPRHRSRSVRTIITEIVMYVGMFVIVGHLCQNLCERFMMQKDLNTMKSDLNSLEMVINNIEIAYDNLRDDIQVFLRKELQKSSSTCVLLCPTRMSMKCMKKLKCVEAEIEKKTTDFMQNFKKSTCDFLQSWRTPVKDETTLTERLMKCFSLDEEDENVKDFQKHPLNYKCTSMSSSSSSLNDPTPQNTPLNQSIQENITDSRLIQVTPNNLIT